MASRSYALESGGPKRLRLSWRLGLRDFRVAEGDSSWALDRAALRQGVTIVLGDGSSLLVKVQRPPWWSVGMGREILLECDGAAVPGSDGHPRQVGRRAARLILLFALLQFALLLLLGIFSPQRARTDLELVILLSPFALTALGAFAFFGSRLAVLLASLFFALQLVLALVGDGRPNPTAIVIQAAVAASLGTAWSRMRPRSAKPPVSVFD